MTSDDSDTHYLLITDTEEQMLLLGDRREGTGIKCFVKPVAHLGVEDKKKGIGVIYIWWQLLKKGSPIIRRIDESTNCRNFQVPDVLGNSQDRSRP